MRKVLIFVSLMAILPSMAWSIDEICSKKYDEVRYEEEDLDCLLQIRSSLYQLRKLIRLNGIDLGQPPQNIVSGETSLQSIDVISPVLGQPPQNIDYRNIFFNRFFGQPPQN